MAGVETRRIALAVLARILLDEVVGEQHDVRLPLAQRRREDREDGQPVVEVGAEPAFLHERSRAAGASPRSGGR